MISCQADYTGRLGFEKRDYQQQDFLYSAFKLLSKVTAKPFVEKGLKGLAIKQAIAQQRLADLKQFKRRYLQQNSLAPNCSN